MRRRLDLDLDRRGGFGLGGLFVVRGDGFLDGVDDGVFHVLDGVLDGLDGVLDGLGGRSLSLVGGLWGGGKGGGMREERGREREKKEEATLSSFADFFSLCGLALFLFSPLSCTSASPLSAVRGGKGLKNRAQKKRERERQREREGKRRKKEHGRTKRKKRATAQLKGAEWNLVPASTVLHRGSTSNHADAREHIVPRSMASRKGRGKARKEKRGARGITVAASAAERESFFFFFSVVIRRRR